MTRTFIPSSYSGAKDALEAAIPAKDSPKKERGTIIPTVLLGLISAFFLYGFWEEQQGQKAHRAHQIRLEKQRRLDLQRVIGEVKKLPVYDRSKSFPAMMKQADAETLRQFGYDPEAYNRPYRDEERLRYNYNIASGGY
jgi:hypothetical protein